MSGEILHSRAREIIIKVDDYFKKEKEDNMVLLQNVTQSMKYAPDNSDDIVIPKQTVMEILKHLQDTNKVTQRVLSATGVAKNTVAKLRREKEIALATGTEIITPIKKKRGKKKFLNEFALSTLKNIINSIHTARKQTPTMREIMAIAQQDLDYKGSETTLRNIIKNYI